MLSIVVLNLASSNVIVNLLLLFVGAIIPHGYSNFYRNLFHSGLLLNL